MESEARDPNSLFDEIERFSKSTPPPANEVKTSRVKPAKRSELIGAAAFMLLPLVVLYLARLIGGASFYVDLLSLGLICLSLLGVVYALSAVAAVFLSKRKASKPVNWVAAGVVDRVMRADGDTPVEHVVLELLDGRRVTLKLSDRVGAMASQGKTGWADIANGMLRRFVV